MIANINERKLPPKSHAYIAIVILKLFDGRVGYELPETWITHNLCVTCETHQARVDEVIDDMLDAGYLRSTVIATTRAPGLVLTADGAML